jgi:hypothetical protein
MNSVDNMRLAAVETTEAGSLQQSLELLAVTDTRLWWPARLREMNASLIVLRGGERDVCPPPFKSHRHQQRVMLPNR